MSIESLILNRRTEKVTCEVESYKPVPADVAKRNRETVLQAVRTAGWAPFHYPREVSGMAEPWRAHILWHDDVEKVAIYLRDELKVTTKEPKLAAASSVLILVTWLPQFYDLESRTEAQISVDE
ncbi:MAG: nitroreductase, partial [Cyanobacteria bacterium J06641_5]